MLHQKKAKALYIVGAIIVSLAVMFTVKDTAEMIRDLALLLPIYSISTVDALIRKIPNPLLITMLVIQVIYLAYYSIANHTTSLLISAGFGLFFGLLVCTLPSLLKIPMGNGDIKYSAVIGACLYIVCYIEAMVVMAILVLIYYLILKAKKTGDLKTQVPMGPFLSIGTVISMCFQMSSLNIFGNIF